MNEQALTALLGALGTVSVMSAAALAYLVRQRSERALTQWGIPYEEKTMQGDPATQKAQASTLIKRVRDVLTTLDYGD